MSERDEVEAVTGEESMSTRSGVQQDPLDRILEKYGLESSDARRIGSKILAGALPVLARGGEIVLREPSGEERAYSFPMPKAGSG